MVFLSSTFLFILIAAHAAIASKVRSLGTGQNRPDILEPINFGNNIIAFPYGPEVAKNCYGIGFFTDQEIMDNTVEGTYKLSDPATGSERGYIQRTVTLGKTGDDCIYIYAVSIYGNNAPLFSNNETAYPTIFVGTITVQGTCRDKQAAITGGTGPFQCAQGYTELVPEETAESALLKITLCNVDDLCYTNPIPVTQSASLRGGTSGTLSTQVNCPMIIGRDPGRAVFCEGNNGRKNLVCNIPADQDFNGERPNGCANDKARSVAFNGPIPAGTTIRLYDSPSGSHDDDYAVITIISDIPKGQNTIVGTFESSRTYDGRVRVDLTRRNGLDGRVSRININAP